MEISQNTLLQLVVRQGSNTDRKQVVLKSGEPGYTTDTKRLYIGTGVLSGGIVVGNLFQGSTSDPTTKVSSEINDTVFNSDTNSLLYLTTSTPETLSSWSVIGGVYSSNSPYISIDSSNVITFNAISSNFISSDAIQTPLYLSGGKISLDYQNPIYLSGGKLSINYQNPIILSGGKIGLDILAPLVLNSGKLALSSTIPFQMVSTNTITVSGGGFRVTVNGLSSTGVKINPLSSNIIVDLNQIYAVFDGLSGASVRFARNVTSSSRLSAGHYHFEYGPLHTSNLLPIVQILGYDALGCQPRVIQISNTSCDIKLLSSGGDYIGDANISLLINY